MSAQFFLKYEVADDEVDGIADSVSAARGPNLKRSDLIKMSVWLGALIVVASYVIAWMFITSTKAWWCLGLAILSMVVSVFFLAVYWTAHSLEPGLKRRLREDIREGFRKLKSRVITWSFGQDGFTNQCGEEPPRQMHWQEIRRIDVTSAVWIIAFRDGRTLLVPAKHITDLTAGFIVFSAREAGARVVIPHDLQARMQLPVEDDYKDMDEPSP